MLLGIPNVITSSLIIIFRWSKITQLPLELCSILSINVERAYSKSLHVLNIVACVNAYTAPTLSIMRYLLSVVHVCSSFVGSLWCKPLKALTRLLFAFHGSIVPSGYISIEFTLCNSCWDVAVTRSSLSSDLKITSSLDKSEIGDISWYSLVLVSNVVFLQRSSNSGTLLFSCVSTSSLMTYYWEHLFHLPL